MMSTPICVEQIGDFQLFLERHGGARRLLAVAQGGVENPYASAVFRAHGSCILPFAACGGFDRFFRFDPLSARLASESSKTPRGS